MTTRDIHFGEENCSTFSVSQLPTQDAVIHLYVRHPSEKLTADFNV